MENVHLYYQGHTVFEDFSWTWPPGEHWQVAGPNGSGKSTLVKLIVGEHLQAYSNRVWILENVEVLGRTFGISANELGWLPLNYR